MHFKKKNNFGGGGRKKAIILTTTKNQKEKNSRATLLFLKGHTTLDGIAECDHSTFSV